MDHVLDHSTEVRKGYGICNFFEDLVQCSPKSLWFQNNGYLKLGNWQLGVNYSWQNASKLTQGGCKSTLVKSSGLSASITCVKSWIASSTFDISVYIVPLRAKALR